MLRSQQPVPQLITQTSSRSLLTAQKPVFTKAASSRNLQPSSPTLSLAIPKTRNVPSSPLKLEEVALVEKKEAFRPERDVQKDRIVITKLNKDSELEFGILSHNTQVLKPLEPFFRAITKDNNQTNLKISPKNALLYREDGLGLLLSKFQKPARDQEHHSMDVKRNDIDDFCEDKVYPARFSKRMSKRSSHRRKSCVCTWCGGASALEKSIQNHPGIPGTICHRSNHHQHHHHHLEESKLTLEILHTPTSESSRQSGWRLKVNTGTPVRTAKKSAYGNLLQTSIGSDMTPRNSVRSSQTMKLSFSEIKKDSVTLETPLLSAYKGPRSSKASRSSIQVEEEAGTSPVSINLEEDTPALTPSPKPTLTLLNRRKQIAPLALRSVPGIYDFMAKGTLSEIKETERVSASDNTNKGLLEVNRKTEGNIFKVKRLKTKRNKTQLSLVSTVQTIKELYTSTCTSPNAERMSPKAQSHRDNGLNRRKKGASSSVSWGFEMPKVPVTATATLEKLSPSDVPQKIEPSPIEGLATFRRSVEKLKVDTNTQTNFSLRSVRTLQNLYKSQAGKIVSSPKGKSTARKDCGPMVFKVDKYLVTA